MKRLLFFLLLFVFAQNLSATHFIAGEITYEYVGPSFQYKIIITTYAKWLSVLSTDNCDLKVFFGDGDSAIAPRVNGPSVNCPSTADGEMILGTTTRKNIYVTYHNYDDGPGNYTITMEEKYRISGICNIPPPSDVVSFFLRSELVINPFLGINNSPTLSNPPIDNACVGVCFEHNPGANDFDGDSLYYSLSSCYSGDGLPIGLWSYPPNMNSGSIDPQSGDLVWCAPTMTCVYNIAIVIKQYRLLHGTNIRYYIGSVLRDLQITVGSCSNIPPQINSVNDTCVIAGSNLNFNVTATDPELTALLLTATGGPLLSTATPPATFTSVSGLGTASGTFNWNPSCSQVQLLPYLVTFKATDSDATPLVNFESVFIRVIAPPPAGLTAVPSGASIILNWNYPFCDSTGSNPLKKFFIYRKNVCDPWSPGPCETGVPSYTGYSLIGTVNYTTTTYIDNNGGAGLTNGVDYSYIVVAYYFDGSQSIASDNICAKLVRDVPIITNVSIVTTDIASGSIWTHWVKPIGSSTNLDTLLNPPPYEYRLMRAPGFNPPLSSYTAEASYTYIAYWNMTDTGFVTSSINTDSQKWTYKVDFYSNGLLKGSTQTASSVFLSSSPADKQVNLSWQHFVPWNNYTYHIYRETFPGSAVFDSIGITTSLTYSDTGLVNEIQYCYKILAVGEYSDTTLPKPLRNFSQIKCEIPVDLIPPCQPTFDVVTDCDVIQNTITWINPNTNCADDDVVQINIYFAPTINDPLQIIYSTTDMSLTSYTLPIYYYDGVLSIAGCYAITAVDSALVPNESPIVNKICIDNCPEYELPNVFTPNADGKNDYFTPIKNWRYVKDVDIKIYDRWGVLMFSTDDPNILWDGKNQGNKKECTDGTYFYVCIVNEIHIDGVQPRVLKGFVQIIKENPNPAK